MLQANLSRFSLRFSFRNLPWSLSPKAAHPKTSRLDFRNQRSEADTGKRRNAEVRSHPKKTRPKFEEIAQSENAEEQKMRKTQRMQNMRLTGIIVTGFR